MLKVEVVCEIAEKVKFESWKVLLNDWKRKIDYYSER